MILVLVFDLKKVFTEVIEPQLFNFLAVHFSFSSRFSRFGGLDFEVSIVTDAVALAFLSHCLMIADPSCRSR